MIPDSQPPHWNFVEPEIQERFRNTKLLALDVDGVMTNGSIIYTDSGEELKIFNVKDGHGLSMLTHLGFPVAIITGRTSPITERRARELGIAHVHQGIKTKLPVLEALADELGLTLAEVAYMGDDTPDIPILQGVGLAICPADAVSEVQRLCHYTTKQPGGQGAVREVADLLLYLNRSEQAIPPALQQLSHPNG